MNGKKPKRLHMQVMQTEQRARYPFHEPSERDRESEHKHRVVTQPRFEEKPTRRLSGDLRVERNSATENNKRNEKASHRNEGKYQHRNTHTHSKTNEAILATGRRQPRKGSNHVAEICAHTVKTILREELSSRSRSR